MVQTPILEDSYSDTGMKKCELCNHLARMYCESDNASLCYDCDQSVHSANFLVTKHSRTLLCHKCQSPTPWSAFGLDLGHAVSVCVNCADENSSRRTVLVEGETSHPENEVADENCVVFHEDGDRETDEDDSEYSDKSEDENEDADNQVVPWSFVASPPATAASSCSEEFYSSRISSDGFGSVTKRERLGAYIDSEEDTLCSSERPPSKRRKKIDDVISVGSFRPLKVIRSDRVGDGDRGET